MKLKFFIHFKKHHVTFDVTFELEFIDEMFDISSLYLHNIKTNLMLLNPFFWKQKNVEYENYCVVV